MNNSEENDYRKGQKISVRIILWQGIDYWIAAFYLYSIYSIDKSVYICIYCVYRIEGEPVHYEAVTFMQKS